MTQTFKQQFERYLADNPLTEEEYSMLLISTVQIKSKNKAMNKQQIKNMIQLIQNVNSTLYGAPHASIH